MVKLLVIFFFDEQDYPGKIHVHKFHKNSDVWLE